MKRDMDLVRDILLAIEALGEDDHFPDELRIDGYSSKVIGHHVYLMGEAGLLRTADATLISDINNQAVPLGITWQGHDFIDTVRKQEVWERTKEALKDAGGGGFGLMLEFGKKVAEGYLKKMLKEKAGIDLGKDD